MIAYDIVQLTGILFGISLLYLFVLKYFKSSRDSIKRKIKKDTMDFCFSDTNNYEELVYATTRINYKMGADDKMPGAKFLFILAHFDKISIALKNGVFDEEILIEYYGKYFQHFYAICRHFILERRETTANSDLFIEYEKLARRWDSELRKPFKFS